jgi:hypothetical protein
MFIIHTIAFYDSLAEAMPRIQVHRLETLEACTHEVYFNILCINLAIALQYKKDPSSYKVHL